MFPATASGNACHQFQPERMAKGITYLDSSQGIIDIKNILNHSGSTSNINYSSINLPNPCFTRIFCSSISFSPLIKTAVGKIAGIPSKGLQPHFE